MFRLPGAGARRFHARTSRLSVQLGQILQGRRLALEALEPKHLLSATSIEFSPPGLNDHAHHHGHEHVPPGLQNDMGRLETHWIDGKTLTFVADPAAPAGVGGEGSVTVASQSLHPITSIPRLHSDPNARVKLYLDFDGHFEAQWGGYSNVSTPVYDRDGDAATFSDKELELIAIAWTKVAEDFAPFNIDVTTEEPPELAPGIPESVANGIAMRVAIGGNSRDWTGGDYGGLAYFDVFTNSTPNVVYVFPAGTGDGRWDGDVSSHEAGHGFGLGHQSLYDAQGNLVNAYHPGDGNWAPIMGNTYIPVTTWHNGTSTSATTYQDDMAVIARSANGFGFRADDHGNSSAAADPLAFDGQVYRGSGLIGANSDVDVWSFAISAQDTYQLRVDPAAIGPNLDAVLELRDAAGALIAAASPAALQAAELLLPLAPASYFISVAKTAAYGWLGAYSLTVSAPPAGVTVAAPDQIVTREGGPAVSFTVALATQPTADVVIPLSSSNTSEATISTTSLSFTPANWNVPQLVSMTPVQDEVRDGDIPYSIGLGPATSDDPEYSELDATDLPAFNMDNSYGGFVYWVDSGTDVIKRSTLHGTNAQTIVDLKAIFGGDDGNYTPTYLDIDPHGAKIYWTDSSAGQILRANLEGSNVETLVSGFTGGGLRGIAIDGAAGKMYWTDAASQKIQRANLDGGGVQDLVTGSLSGVRGIALDPAGGKMYWADINGNTIRRANLDGSNIQVLWSGVDVDRPAGIVLDAPGGKMYWTDYGRDKIMRANLDGSNAEGLIDLYSSSQDARPYSLVIDPIAGKLYFSDLARRSLHRANLDGSDLVTIASDGLLGIQGIAILLPSVRVIPSTGLLTSESGAAATFKLTLNVPPKADVLIPIGSSNPAEGVASTNSVTFTPANWNVSQTVTVTGMDDAVLDGNASYEVLLGPASSADPDYAGVDPRNVSVTNVDNEVKFYVVNDATTDISYKYAADGTARGSSALGTGNTAPRGVASTIVGDKTWVVDDNRKVYVYSGSGALLGSWTAGTLANNATPEGIATNGVDVWIVDSKSDKVFRYAGAASRLSGSQNAASSFNLNNGNTGAKDVVTDGQSLWVVDDGAKTDKVFKYSLPGSLLGSWTIDAANKAPTGITLDPANVSHIWIVDSGTDRVYQYNSAVGRTSGSQSAATSFGLAAGNTNPQGIADPPTPAPLTSASPDVPAKAVALSSDLAFAATTLKEGQSQNVRARGALRGASRTPQSVDVGRNASRPAWPAAEVRLTNTRDWTPPRRGDFGVDTFAAEVDAAIAEVGLRAPFRS